MKIVIFTHPPFHVSQSMPRFAKMLGNGMESRGHEVEFWTAEKFFYRVISPFKIKKWLGYIDQFLIFPLQVKIRLRKYGPETLFVFADQALGPWMPLVAKRRHIVHCHDFLAQRSALGEIPENKVGVSGKIYQMYIRRGYRKGRNFISISQKTQSDLHRFLNTTPQLSEVVYNGLNQNFHPACVIESRKQLGMEFQMDLASGYILHVGGNQFYKNRKGVIKIYNAWREMNDEKLPLLLIGFSPTEELRGLKNSSAFASDIYFLTNVTDQFLQVSYQGASVLLYPSLEEGFGWPIAEAMASGCPVVTTNRNPMKEVGGEDCYYIPRYSDMDEKEWTKECAGTLKQILELPQENRQKLIQAGIKNAKRFATQKALNRIESLYKSVL